MCVTMKGSWRKKKGQRHFHGSCGSPQAIIIPSIFLDFFVTTFLWSFCIMFHIGVIFKPFRVLYGLGMSLREDDKRKSRLESRKFKQIKT